MTGDYLGDLEKTGTIYNLFQVPFEARNDAWASQFFNNVADASFRDVKPQVIDGPDGFPYFVLMLPEPGQPFQCFVIRHMIKDYLLEKGFGVVIEPQQARPQWAFSYGDVLGFHLRNTFEIAPKSTDIPPGHSVEIVKEKEEVLVGQPSETLLPKVARAVLRKFLEAQGIKEPKILLIQRGAKKFQTGPELVFALSAEEVGGEERLGSLLTWISWFLPRDYSFYAMPGEGTFKSDFADL